MNFIISRVRGLLRNDSGQDLLEYALLVALIAVVAVVAVSSTGDGVVAIFNRITTDLGSALN